MFLLTYFISRYIPDISTSTALQLERTDYLVSKHVLGVRDVADSVDVMEAGIASVPATALPPRTVSRKGIEFRHHIGHDSRQTAERPFRSAWPQPTVARSRPESRAAFNPEAVVANLPPVDASTSTVINDAPRHPGSVGDTPVDLMTF